RGIGKGGAGGIQALAGGSFGWRPRGGGFGGGLTARLHRSRPWDCWLRSCPVEISAQRGLASPDEKRSRLSRYSDCFCFRRSPFLASPIGQPVNGNLRLNRFEFGISGHHTSTT